MEEIKNIIFDFGKVIINVETERVSAELIKKGVGNVDEVHDHLLKSKIYFGIETGEISPEQFRDEIRRISGDHLGDKDIDDTWNIMIRDIPPEREQLLRALKDRYRVFLLSNTNAIHYEFYHHYFKEKFGYPLNDLFDKAYYSHQMGRRKPDPAIYRMVLDDSGLVAEETLFIDDKLKNVQAANSVGIKGFLLHPDTDITELFDEAYRFLGSTDIEEKTENR